MSGMMAAGLANASTSAKKNFKLDPDLSNVSDISFAIGVKISNQFIAALSSLHVALSAMAQTPEHSLQEP